MVQFAYCDTSKPELNCLNREDAEFAMRGKSVVILSNQRSIEKVNKREDDISLEIPSVSIEDVSKPDTSIETPSLSTEDAIKPDYTISETSRLYMSYFNTQIKTAKRF